jgi:hypothetical protein
VVLAGELEDLGAERFGTGRHRSPAAVRVVIVAGR